MPISLVRLTIQNFPASVKSYLKDEIRANTSLHTPSVYQLFRTIYQDYGLFFQTDIFTMTSEDGHAMETVYIPGSII